MNALAVVADHAKVRNSLMRPRLRQSISLALIKNTIARANWASR